ncbi:hypothetical protein L7F22_004654 [Adiantum nelumboides]|nr:hypothetical protein [Adiantum nelumboides]
MELMPVHLEEVPDAVQLKLESMTLLHGFLVDDVCLYLIMARTTEIGGPLRPRGHVLPNFRYLAVSLHHSQALELVPSSLTLKYLISTLSFPFPSPHTHTDTSTHAPLRLSVKPDTQHTRIACETQLPELGLVLRGCDSPLIRYKGLLLSSLRN